MMEDFVSVLNGFLHIRNLDVYVTGSNSKFLSSDVVTEFRGRGDEIKEQECRLLFSVEGFLRKRFGSVWTRMRPEAVCGQARFGDNSVGKLRGIL